MNKLRRLLRRLPFGMRNLRPEEHVDFWVKDGLRNIIPPGTQHPAGWDEAAFLRQVAGLLRVDTMFELGCGRGRLCGAFRPDQYLGVDINAEAIATASRENPGYTFQTIEYGAPYPTRDLCLAYTVLLHVDDNLIGGVAARIKAGVSQLLLVEILGRHWRRGGSKVPVFNRERADYEHLFGPMTLEMEIRRPYRRYPGTEISFLHFVAPKAAASAEAG
jgi:SAM-dependent methyltransferase